jgi:purine-binding chemotaxis protein CheW
MSSAAPGLEPQQFLTFRLGPERYALPLARAREILHYTPLTPVPGVPPSIRGVIHLRGQVVPVVDLGVRFRQPPSPPTAWSCFILVEVEIEGEPALLGVPVDVMEDVVELAPEDVVPPPPFGAAIREEFLLGMGRHGDGFVPLLDVDRVLAPHELLAVA